MQEHFVAVIVALGEGEVVSYGDVAEDAGFPGRSRAVGALLSNSPIDLPWWRVVRSDGRLATPPTAGQAALLRAEGIILRRDRVVESPGGRFARSERPGPTAARAQRVPRVRGPRTEREPGR